MPGKSDYLEDAVLNGTLRNTGIFAQSGSVYVGLKTADPTDAGSGGMRRTGRHPRPAGAPAQLAGDPGAA